MKILSKPKNQISWVQLDSAEAKWKHEMQKLLCLFPVNISIDAWKHIKGSSRSRFGSGIEAYPPVNLKAQCDQASMKHLRSSHSPIHR